ncbi:MAG: radical SAM protein [Candidatus Stahlbacteria bacterium]|nr:radical SAM protein [Candidatus Stahlbacteria bacterium]
MELISVNLLVKLGQIAAFNPAARKFLLNQMSNRMYQDLILINADKRPLKAQENKYAMGEAMIASINRAFESGNISSKSARGLFSGFLGNVFFGGFYKRREFIKSHGFKPPFFITISPTGVCNLKCVGCYASANAGLGTLPYSLFDKIISEAKELWGTNFFVISGGEPLIYKSEGHNFLDIARKHSDCFFLMYTNGTKINEGMALEIADLGNITPSISVEGLKKETDERRGPDVFEKTVRAMKNLRDAGVPFGISITAFKHNTDLITSPEFIDFYFKEQGAIYGWIFHYMPIGRGFTLEHLPTAEQRVHLLNKEWELVKERKIFIADFWNSGTSSDGCICAARGGGYFYIDWNTNIMPCVFIPYSVHNIKQVYESGGNLDTIINSDLFKSIRKWQDEYGYKQPADKIGNWFRPCPMRDHHADLHKILKSTSAHPINDEAKEALEDTTYREGLIHYGEEIERLTHEEWEKEYLAKKKI